MWCGECPLSVPERGRETEGAGHGRVAMGKGTEKEEMSMSAASAVVENLGNFPGCARCPGPSASSCFPTSLRREQLLRSPLGWFLQNEEAAHRFQGAPKSRAPGST